jgi:hypothetical protein
MPSLLGGNAAVAEVPQTADMPALPKLRMGLLSRLRFRRTA